jgi:drug/metabolite transporter (DMT)-like permease
MFAVILALAAALLFGASTPASKSLLTGVHPVQLAGWLYLGAALGVVPMLRGGRPRLPSPHDRKNRARLAGSIVFGGVVGPVALLLGLKIASAAAVSLWLNLEIVATAALGYFVFKDHLGPRGWVAVAVVVLSGALLSAGEGAAGWTAGLLIAVACLCWGMDNHLTALIDGVTPAQTTFWKGVSAGSFNLILAGVLGAGWPGTGLVLMAVGVGVFSYGLSIALYVTSAQIMGATRAQLFFAAAPFFGAILSWWLLREDLEGIQAISGGLMLAALALLLWDQHAHEHTHEAMEHDHMHRHDDGHHDHHHPGLPATHRHSHRHRHGARTHSHAHWPDIHHRHAHAADGGGNEGEASV